MTTLKSTASVQAAIAVYNLPTDYERDASACNTDHTACLTPVFEYTISNCQVIVSSL